LLFPQATLVRLNVDGSLDMTFGDNGMIVEQNMPKKWANFISVALQSDGKIIAAGSQGTDMADSDSIRNCLLYLVRYTASGERDISFGLQGAVALPITAMRSKERSLERGLDIINKIVLQPDGKIVVVGSSDDLLSLKNSNNFFLKQPDRDSFIARFNSDGSFDHSFGSENNGAVVTSLSSLGNEYTDCVIAKNGKIITLGSALHEETQRVQWCLVRYLSNGLLDTTFGKDKTGVVYTYLGDGDALAKNIVMQKDGKMLVTGVVQWQSGTQFTMARYNQDGSLDGSFGSDGTGIIKCAIRDTVENNDYSLSLVCKSDGKLLVAGDSAVGNHYDFALVQYKP
jgi:uncharacterized delta-60 repeat protein